MISRSSAPVRAEKRKNLLLLATLVSACIYIGWRWLFTLPLELGILSIIFGILLVLSESCTIIETISHFLNARFVKIPEMPEIPTHMYPDVDVLITTHNETEELIYKTLNGCKFMKYPGTGKVHIYLCDDTNRPGMRRLAEKMGVNYLGFSDNKHAKAGNLNYALARTNSPLIAMFDADMIPRSNFLLETVPYFFIPGMIKEKGQWRERTEAEQLKDLKIGYVQTQQSFYNPDMLQRNLYLEKNAPNEQDYFYREVNVGRMRTNSAAYAGSNVVFSRKALDDSGGIATHSVTEDLATSIVVEGMGYTGIAVDKELAHGLSPEDAYSFIKQRQRWSRGSAQAVPTLHFLMSGLSLSSKWNYLVSYFYWWTFVRRAVFIICPILYGLFGVHVANVTLVQILVFFVPFYTLYILALRILSAGTQSVLWSCTIDTVQFPYLMLPIIGGTLKLHIRKFFVTPKEKVTGKNSHIALATPHVILFILSVLAIINCANEVFVYHHENAIVVLFWLLFNTYLLLKAILYYVGRMNNRIYERMATEVSVTVHTETQTLSGVTYDLSEGGMAILLPKPEYLPFDSDFTVEAQFETYKAGFKARVRQVQQQDKNWKYSLTISEISDNDKRQYLQIIFDRAHLLPRVITLSFITDLMLIIRGLRAKYRRGERRLPRMDMHVTLASPETGSVDVVNFNYKYLTLKDQKHLPDRLSIYFSDEIRIWCVKDVEISKTRLAHDSLYQIEDWKNLATDSRFRELIMRYYDKNWGTQPAAGSDPERQPGLSPDSSPEA